MPSLIQGMKSAPGSCRRSKLTTAAWSLESIWVFSPNVYIDEPTSFPVQPQTNKIKKEKLQGTEMLCHFRPAAIGKHQDGLLKGMREVSDHGADSMHTGNIVYHADISKERYFSSVPSCLWVGRGEANNLWVTGWSSVAQAVPASTTNNCANKYKHKNHSSLSCDQLIKFVFAAKQKFHELPLASLPILVIPVLSGQEQDGVEHFFCI